MKTVKENGTSLRNHWANQQQGASALTVSDFLGKQWKDVVVKAQEEKQAVLLVSWGTDLVGTAIPSEFLEEFKLKLPHVEDAENTINVPVKDFKNNFAKYRDLLDQEKNLILRDENAKPVIGVANKIFSALYLQTDEAGKVSFRGDAAEYLFTDKVFNQEEYDRTHPMPEFLNF